MFCPNCGNQLADGASFCDKCGAPINADPRQSQPDFGQQPPYGQGQYMGGPQQPPYGQGQYMGNPYPYGLAPVGMKWYKFLIYFMLFAVAILNIAGGIEAIMGGQYTTEEGENVAKAVYEMLPKLKPIDVVYGISCISLGVFQIFTRFQLAKFKKNAPKCITAMYIATAAITVIYTIAVLSVAPNDIINHSNLISNTVGSVIGSVVVLCLDKIYFDKREYLFVN